MIRFAANLSMRFCDKPFLERFEAAAQAGFKAVETQFPYAGPAERQARELTRLGLQQVLINLPAGNLDAGERGIACHPDRIEEFRVGVDRAIGSAADRSSIRDCSARSRDPAMRAGSAANICPKGIRSRDWPGSTATVSHSDPLAGTTVERPRDNPPLLQLLLQRKRGVRRAGRG